MTNEPERNSLHNARSHMQERSFRKSMGGDMLQYERIPI